ncbi:MAG: hypothetical protein QW666_00105 [Candidatus Woesearchaeota archaeon]
MVEFNTAYYSPMDRNYHESVEMEPKAKSNIEEPIIPMIELGQTIPEKDPSGRFRNLIQTAQAAIRRGAGRIQIMLSEPHQSAFGGRPKAYGPEVREQLREVFKANEAKLVGVELPTRSLTNLSGFDHQSGRFNKQTQTEHLEEVRDAIKFAADTAEGGGVDIVAFEFPRPLIDASWNKIDPKTGRQLFKDDTEPTIHFVDDRSGKIVDSHSIHDLERMPITFDKETGKRFEYDLSTRKFVIRDENGQIIKSVSELPVWKWSDFVKWGEENNKPPSFLIIDEYFENKRKDAASNLMYYKEHTFASLNVIEQLKAKIDDPKFAKQKEILKKQLEEAKDSYENYRKSYENVMLRIKELNELSKHVKPLNEFAKACSIFGYAEAGAMARQETHNNIHAKNPVSIGPELGWPTYYGGHPAEFAELIKEARKKMVELLTSKEIKDPLTGEIIANPYFDPKISKEEAMKEAKTHIKGCFDTSHMGMWLKNFRPDLPYDERVKEFNKWYMEEIKKLAKDDIVGSIQLVNSMSAAHGHNPPGQGIFPVVEAAKEFKRQGFKGFMVSEGHDEENFDEGRILVETWRAFNAPFESKYGPGTRPQGFRDMQSSYIGRQYSPRQMFGSYTPPFGEYKPWSEIPFE